MIRRHVLAAGLAGLLGPSQPARASAGRLVTIGGAVTETVFALGQGGRIVAVDSTSRFPAQVGALAQVGYLRALAPEGLMGLAPDLMLVSEEARDTYAPAPKNMGAAEIVQPEADDTLLQAAQTVADQGTEAYRQWWQAASKDARTALMGQHETLKARAAEVDRTRPALPPAAPADAVDPFVAEMEAAEAAGAHDADR